MNYSNIISEFTWSYSRLTAFEHCPYGFFLSYIKPHSQAPQFFASYGSFLHRIMELYLRGELKKEELPGFYLARFRSEVEGRAPDQKVFRSYFEQGLDYLIHMDFPYQIPCAAERRVDFYVGGNSFTGIVDCVVQDGGDIIILDHKSRVLKPRSGRKKPTRSDRELDDYLRQLYLYSIPVRDIFHQYPKRLEFNCFRSRQIISEPFSESALERTGLWAEQTIARITANEDWSPKMDPWKCRYLCTHYHQCEYYLMNRR